MPGSAPRTTTGTPKNDPPGDRGGVSLFFLRHDFSEAVRKIMSHDFSEVVRKIMSHGFSEAVRKIMSHDFSRGGSRAGFAKG